MKRKILLLLLFIPLYSLFAQEILKEDGSWFSLTHKITLSDKLSVGHITQNRRVDYFDKTQVWMFKPSLNYGLNDQLSFGLGFVYFRSFPNGPNHAPIKKSEKRIWQHLTFKGKLGAWNLNNRFVFEQRFKDVVDKSVSPAIIDGTSYAQRFRYRIYTTFNLHTFSGGKVLLGKLSNEIRVRFKTGLSQPDFDQNNLYGFIGMALRKNSTFWIGYGRDYLKVNSDTFIANDILHMSLSYNFDLRSK